MLKNSVLILGDSTSMSIGIDGVSYPYLLSEAKIWEEDTKLINCSLPGFTSADLCAFFFNNINSFGDIQSVIIYPGNCDTMSSELERPKYSKYYIYKKKFKQIVSKNKPLKLKNKLLYFKWNNEFRQEIEAPTTVDNYTFNIEKIVNYCVDKSIQVILINPVAHKHFPSGVGSGNFSFYHYYDIDDRLSRLIEIEDKRFIDAYKYFELENYEKAAAHYKDILETPGVLSSNLEFQTLVVNNFAVCQAKLKKFDEAILLLNIIKKEINVRREIVLYNLATISKSISKIDEYNRYIEQSYEFDTFMYRVRDPYRKVVSGIADKYKIPMLDIADISDDDSFIDHCHLLPNYHKKVAEFIKINIETFGAEAAILQNYLFNPEYALGNEKPFEDYFKVYSKLSVEEINKQINYTDQRHENNFDDSLIHSELIVAINNIKKHPCFNTINQILLAKPKCPSDLGRFSEFFSVRFLIPYIEFIDNNHSLSQVFNDNDNLLRSSNDLLNILPILSREYVENKVLDLTKDQAIEWVKSILNSCVEQLSEHLLKGSQIDTRLKTTIFWFFREVLRFGSHSRVSMRYDRVLLENITEALAFASVVDLQLIKSKYLPSIVCLSDLLKTVVSVHNYYSGNFSPKKNNTILIGEYNKSLQNLHKELRDKNIC